MAKDASLATAALLRAGEVFAEQLGQPERAIAAYERVLERESGNLAAMLALDTLYRQQSMWKSLADLQLRIAKFVGDGPGTRRPVSARRPRAPRPRCRTPAAPPRRRRSPAGR